jgi:hypothetical protein
VTRTFTSREGGEYHGDVASWVRGLSEPILRDLEAGRGPVTHAQADAGPANPAPTRQGPRETIHDAVNRTLDCAGAAAAAGLSLLDRMLGVVTDLLPGVRESDAVPLVTLDRVPAGATGRARVSARNTGEDDAPVTLVATDLLSAGRAAIPATAVTFAPASRFMVQPRSAASFEVAVQVPLGVQPGNYAGFIEAVSQSSVLAVLSVQVT